MPLKNIKVLELAGLAPAPFCGMILADFGASVIRVDKTGVLQRDVLGNGKRSIALNLKSEKGAEIFKKLSDNSDVVIDPFRKGVMEKLKLGPQDLTKSNDKLIYARLTGYGQQGPYSNMAGHDINYLALSVNFAADFGGGGLICALGIIMALYERTQSQRGQIIDASMVEGTAYVGSWLFRSQKMPGLWGNPRGKNILDTGTHFYDTYETEDGKYMAIGALEPQFYAVLLEKLGLTEDYLPQFNNFEENRKKLSDIFKTKTQNEWNRIFDGTDACVTPVLSLNDAANHMHNKSLKTFSMDENEITIPNPSPRLSRTPGSTKAINHSNPEAGEHSRDILFEYGFNAKEVDDFIKSKVVQQIIKKSKL
ncbi:hypothetical protein PV328_005706 [Microctonus aethiopoides]|uniref:Alpha-methylacyl-CoA racemase n=1 Tax=Microctonus aethiopoides TaxID=144406 RepID=A0AA39FMK1_9HYME|nr:hypothetical protein PV328_005706 [Microctonus aethiopoides]